MGGRVSLEGERRFSLRLFFFSLPLSSLLVSGAGRFFWAAVNSRGASEVAAAAEVPFDAFAEVSLGIRGSAEMGVLRVGVEPGADGVDGPAAADTVPDEDALASAIFARGATSSPRSDCSQQKDFSRDERFRRVWEVNSRQIGQDRVLWVSPKQYKHSACLSARATFRPQDVHFLKSADIE